jgi:hypothetical protein
MYLVPRVVCVLRVDYDLTRTAGRRRHHAPVCASNPEVYADYYVTNQYDMPREPLRL